MMSPAMAPSMGAITSVGFPGTDALQQTHIEVDKYDKGVGVEELSIEYFAARIEELRRDWPLLLADADVGQRLRAEIAGAGFDETMREVLGAGIVPDQAASAA